MQTAESINQTCDLLALVENTGARLKRAGGYYVGACPMCGGKDRFTLKHTPQGWRWHCRKCGDGKYHNALDFVMARQSLDFKSALHYLGGETTRRAGQPTPATEPPPPTLPELPSADWQAAAWREVDTFAAALQNQHGNDYLTGRGLLPSVLGGWNLGTGTAYDPVLKVRRLAVSFPWFDLPGYTLDGVKYRFTDNTPGGLRYSARKGSVFLLYGMAYRKATDTLLLVEGEINMLSCWQTQPQGVTVLSTGGEGGASPDRLKAALMPLLPEYRRVYAWLDNSTKAAEAAKAIGATPLQTPQIDGVKYDANRMLQAGLLPGFLQRALQTECHPLTR